MFSRGANERRERTISLRCWCHNGVGVGVGTVRFTSGSGVILAALRSIATFDMRALNSADGSSSKRLKRRVRPGQKQQHTRPSSDVGLEFSLAIVLAIRLRHDGEARHSSAQTLTSEHTNTVQTASKDRNSLVRS